MKMAKLLNMITEYDNFELIHVMYAYEKYFISTQNNITLVFCLQILKIYK